MPLDLAKEGDFYVSCYADTWKLSNGTLRGFNADACRERAWRHSRQTPDALVKAQLNGRTAGIIELDTERGADEGVGWITLFYLLPEFRGKNLAVQLLGHAESVYKESGRDRLCLNVTDRNTAALTFYRRFGFEERSTEARLGYSVMLMEKEISR